MKRLSEKQSLAKLREIKKKYRDFLRENYEHRAKNCLTCETQGACCLDAHFVNVHVARLEAVSIRAELEKLSPEKQKEIYARATETVEKYDLKSGGETSSQTFACPLFEKGIGCLVHTVKPAPCIQHACYEKKVDLPPDELQTEAERKIERLEAKTYQQNPLWLPLPIWLTILNPFKKD